MRAARAFPAGAAIGIVTLAAATGAAALVVAAAGLLVGWAVVAITGRYALTGVETSVAVTPARLRAGERATVEISLWNRKPLPIPWLELRLELPEDLELVDAPAGARRSVAAAVSCGAHERLIIRAPVLAPRRGAYPLGPLRLRAGDWLGFSQLDRTDIVDAAVIVHPAPLAVRDRHRPSLRPIAETAVRRGLLPDPLRFRGIREHRPGDPRKQIHWKASARLATLQTRLYEPATSLDAVFLLNVASYEQYWVQADPDATETAISATAELARIAADAGRQVGLVTNGIDGLTRERPRAALGRGPKPLRRVLDTLARLGPYAGAAAETVFLRDRARLPWGATLVLVTPVLPPPLAAAAIGLRRSGHRLLVLTIVPPEPEVAASLRQHDITLDALAASRWAAAVS